MHPASLFFVSIVFALPQDTDAARGAIVILKKAEATIAVDDKAPGKPVVGINL